MKSADWFPQALRRRPHWTLDELFELVCGTPSDVWKHCPTLCALSQRCRHVTEFGTRYGVSTVALLAGRPKRLTTYDVQRRWTVDVLERVATDTRFQFCQGDTTQIDIEPADLLFVDTKHTYAQLKRELDRHAEKSRRYLVFHDTSTFGHRGEDGGPGLRQATDEFLSAAVGGWNVLLDCHENNGLIVLERNSNL